MTHYYPVKEAGFIFTDEVVASINLALFKKAGDPMGKIRHDEATFLKLAGEHRLPDAFYDLSPVLNIHESIQVRQEFEGVVRTYDATLAKDEADIIDDEPVTYICYLPLDEEPSYLEPCAPYHFSDEMLNELKEKLKGYLPEEFDYGKYFCMISGVYLS